MNKRRISYANVVSTLALFAALGGTSYAAITLPSSSVGTRQLRNGAVTMLKLAPSAVRTLTVKAAAAAGKKGATGKRGSTGARGVAGARGAAGPRGDAGPRGATGPQGPAGPQGAAGAPGAQGQPGPQGPAGPTWGTTLGGVTPPVAAPGFPLYSVQVSVPSAGTLLVLAQTLGLSDVCALTSPLGCNFGWGLYLDGSPISGSGHTVSALPGATALHDLAFGGTVNNVTAGVHTISLTGALLNSGAIGGSSSTGSPSIQALLLGSGS